MYNHQQQQQNYGAEPFSLNEFQFDSEMGPVADISTFPPTMAPHPSEDNMGTLTMDNILSSGFWDSMLVPGNHISSPTLKHYSLFSQAIIVWMVLAVALFSVLEAAV